MIAELYELAKDPREYATTKRLESLESVNEVLDDIVKRAANISSKHPTMWGPQDIVLAVLDIRRRLGL